MPDLLGPAQQPLPHLLLQLIVIVPAARVLGALASRVGQPRVVGEIAAGILLGPSLLGRLLPHGSQWLFSPESMLPLQLLSQVGVLLFLFAVGTEFDLALLRGKAMSSVIISHISILVPFASGGALSLALYTDYAPAGASFAAFALFCGIAMSITAFPVLARILAERQLTGTPLGITAITCAAVDDVTAWILLAFVVGATTSQGDAAVLLTIVGLLIVFLLLMWWIVRPLLSWVLGRLGDQPGEALTPSQLTVILFVLLASSFFTETIGIHAFFGAFVAGVVMPVDRRVRVLVRERVEDVTSVCLLPMFFTYTGLRTQIGLLDDVWSWAICLLIVVVATVGKFGGTAVAARWTGHPWRESMALGSLMNTRGLMELIALNVGYDLGIMTPQLFTMMVVMALVTTAMTGPLLAQILREKYGALFHHARMDSTLAGIL